MTLQPKLTARERILVYGQEGTGKTAGILSVARYCPEVRFRVYDSDYSYARLLETHFEDVYEIGNVEVFDPEVDGDPDDPWGTLTDWVKAVREAAEPNDWCVIDSVSPAWDDVQAWYSENIFGKDIADYFMEKRAERQKAAGKDKKAERGGMLDGDNDWGVINKEYSRKFANLLLRMPCHVYLTAETSKLGNREDKEVADLYDRWGIRPKGQKRTGHIMQTVLLCQKNRRGAWSLTTVKDRGRDEMDKLEIEDCFALDYLVEVAGWDDV